MQARYTLAGVIFGMLFPVASLTLEYTLLGQPLASPLAVAADNPIHAIVALAPLVLGATFSVIGWKQARLWQTANCDSLTGQPNRHRLHHDLAKITRRALRSPCHVLSIDLDRFKFINDTFGHQVGDELLKSFVARLSDHLDSRYTLYRLGGDEFLVLAPDCDHANAMSCADSIIESIAAPFLIDRREISVGGSIGITKIFEYGDIPNDILGRADTALYAAKSIYGNEACFYSDVLGENSRRRTALEGDIREGLKRGEFFLDYQPIADARSGKISGFEALVRWNHPERGRLSPIEFINVIESSDIVVPFGEMVLYMACCEAVSWPEEIAVSVNVSPEQFKQRDFVGQVMDLLEKSGFPPDRLVLEITESLFTVDVDQVAHALRTLRSHGIRIALDDFGTGFSSINHLRQFKLDTIKLDKSFSRNSNDLREQDLIRVVSEMSLHFDLELTAEGVETAREWETMRAQGANHVQGFYLSPPIAASDVLTFLSNRTMRHAEARLPQDPEGLPTRRPIRPRESALTPATARSP